MISARTTQRPGVPVEDAVWLSLCGSLLFLSVGKAGSPFAFVLLDRVRFAGVEPARSTLILDGGEDDEGRLCSLHLVFLLPDSRWQVLEAPQIAIEVCDKSQLETWVLCLSELS